MKHVRPYAVLTLIVLLLLNSGCRKETAAHQRHLDRVVLQTDWFAQPEHGGFYQALAKGYYADEGLDVTILQGGPNAMSTQKILKGSAHFAMHRADAICLMTERGIDVQMVMATLQHDPQGIMLHDSNPITSFEQLDGVRIMAVPGLSWIKWVEAKYGIELDIIPHDFGLQRFLNDETFIQQCLVTNEPFYAKLAGADPRVMLLRDTGFDPYHGIYCLTRLVEKQPGLVRRFVRASIRGWRDFILGDPAPAMQLIRERNPRMTEAFMQYCYDAMVAGQLVTGDDKSGSHVGMLETSRLDRIEAALQETGLIEGEKRYGEQWYTTEFCIMPADAPAHVHP